MATVSRVAIHAAVTEGRPRDRGLEPVGWHLVHADDVRSVVRDAAVAGWPTFQTPLPLPLTSEVTVDPSLKRPNQGWQLA